MAQLETFVWGDDFITGVESVDQQHHGLVALFNELSEALMTGQDLDAGDAYLAVYYTHLTLPTSDLV